MVHARSRFVAVLAVLVATTASIVAISMVAPAAAPAVDAGTQLPTRTLFLTERFTQSGPSRDALTSAPYPETILAMRGEREGFQLAVQNTTGVGPLAAQVVPDAALADAGRSGLITFELLRVGFVNLPQGSTGMGTSGGMYADPLPPFVNEKTAGRLSIASGQWGGVVVLAKVRTDATPGTYSANLELSTADGVVHARQAFTVEVRPTRLRQSGERNSFKTVLGVEGEAYWLQHPDMRNRPKGTSLWPDRMAQVSGLLSFLDERNITPREFPFANPADTGAYSCSYQDKGLASKSYLSQLKSRYFAPRRPVDPSNRQFRARFMPTATYGCVPDGTTKPYEATYDKLKTPGVKQDDYLKSNAYSWFKRVAGVWSTNSLWRGNSTYVKNPFDEPGDASAAQRRTMSTQVPAANVALHRAVGRKAKVVLAGWPRDGRNIKKCRPYRGGKRCTTLSGDTYDNRKMWDGKGYDDVDVWMPHFSRLYGRTTPRILRPYKVNRSTDYLKRLQRIRKMKPNRETWAYNFFTATKRMPQLSIDAPGTDPQLQAFLLARDGHTGLYVSNLMLGWSSRDRTFAGTNLLQKGNPYDGAMYFKHSQYGYAAGWGTFIYPGYVPELGLDSEARRNSTAAEPVSSLRMEGLREGTEDGNLVQMYRDLHGESWTQIRLRRLFPMNRYWSYPRKLGNVVGPVYYNNASLPQRIERTRRQMILELEQPSKKKRVKRRR